MYKTIKIKPLALHDLAADEQPAFKAGKDASALTNAELLSLIIGASTSKYNELEIARTILSEADNSLANLAKMSAERLQAFEGVGKTTAKRIHAAMELSRRRLSESANNLAVIKNSKDAYNIVSPVFIDKVNEECWVALMDNRHKVLSLKQISKGGQTQTTVDPKTVLRFALEAKATCLILAHNHPSGHAEPSSHDNAITGKLKIASEAIDIQFTDHIIYCEGSNYFSYADEGRL